MPSHNQKMHFLRGSCLATGGLLLLAGAGYLVWANYLPRLPAFDVGPGTPNDPFHRVVDAAYQLPAHPTVPNPLFDPEHVTLPALRTALRGSLPLLDRVSRDLETPVSKPLPTSPSEDERTLTWQRIRWMTSRMIAAAVLYRREGKPARAADFALGLMEIGCRLARETNYAGSIVGSGQVAQAIRQIEPCVPAFSPAEARRLRQRVDALRRTYPRYADVMPTWSAAEAPLFRQQLLDPEAFQRLAEPEDEPPKTRWARAKMRVRWFVYPKPIALASEQAYYRRLEANARRPYPQRVVVPEPANELAENALIVAAEYGINGENFTGDEAKMELLSLELALREYRGQRGSYPSRLADLVPGFIASVPDDPFSGRAFVYRTTATGYLLYSVGPDGKDDGGRPLPRPGALSQSVVDGDRGDLVAGKLSRGRKER